MCGNKTESKFRLVGKSNRKVLKRRESNSLGIVTSADGNRRRQKKFEESTEEQTNFQEEGLEVERKHYESKIERKS